jgi:hypothetical protein
MSFSIARSPFHFSGTSTTEPVPGNGPTIPGHGPTDQKPQAIGWALPDDGVDFSARSVIVCQEGTEPMVKVEGNKVTVDCVPSKPKRLPSRASPTSPSLTERCACLRVASVAARRRSAPSPTL